MRTFKNKQFHILFAVFLLFVSVNSIFLVVKLIDHENFISNDFEENSSEGATLLKIFNFKNNQSICAVNDNMPIFKRKRNANVVAISTSNVDFPTINKSDIYVQKSIRFETNSNNDQLSKNDVSYSYNLEQKKEINSIVNQSVADQNNTYQTNQKEYQTNIDIQNVEINNSKFQSTSNTTSNSFLANYTLTISNDLTENNSPMLINGESNPGDPGVPVGDGTWILLGLAFAYVWKTKLINK
ncbi:MAG: hypothetical protein WCJ61_16585, partial [Paludibacter sp.]